MDAINGVRLATDERYMFMASGETISHHADCGSCDWDAMSLQSQREFAEKHVKETGHTVVYWTECETTLTPMSTRVHKVVTK
jgi:hypothetical protein